MHRISIWTGSFSAVVQRQISRVRPRAPYVVVLLLLTALAGFGYAQSGSSEQNLAGAWNVTIDFGGVIPACSAPALNNRDGGVISNACAANESPGYGQWVRTGNHEFAVTFVGLEYGPDPVPGTYKVRASVTLSDEAQEFSGPFQADTFDLNGNLTGSITGTVTGKRIVVEPL